MDSRNITRRNAILAPQRREGLTVCGSLANPAHVAFAQNGTPSIYPSRPPSPRQTIVAIFLFSPDPQMIDIAAGRIVARVKQYFSMRDRTIGHLPSHPVNPSPLPAIINQPIATARVFCAQPFNAAVSTDGSSLIDKAARRAMLRFGSGWNKWRATVSARLRLLFYSDHGDHNQTIRVGLSDVN